MPAPIARGRFVWHELMTNNTDAAAAFYGKVIGWKTQAWDPDSSYKMFAVNDVAVAGYLPLPDQAKLAGSPPHWMTYIGVPDVDAAVRQATGLGAQVHVAPRDIPHAGRFAVLADPQGATFAVFRGDGPDVPQPEMGGFSWHELATTDYQAAWKFYRTLFGWEQIASHDMGPAGVYLEFGLGGKALGGIYNKTLEVPMPNWLPYIRVPLADDTGKAATRAGGRVILDPLEVPGGDRVVVFLDPQGAAIAGHSKGAAPAKKAAGKKKPAKKKPAKKKPAKKKPKAKKRRR
jgi:predicted enzyme related to lactoylglutathione lyase